MSFDILMPTKLYNLSGQIIGLYVYYFGHDHLPYQQLLAVLAIFMFTTFNLLTQVLRTFMDAFQGCYRFEPYDTGLRLFLRIAILAIFTSTQGIFCVWNTFYPSSNFDSYRQTLQIDRESAYNVTLSLIQLSFQYSFSYVFRLLVLHWFYMVKASYL